MAWGECPSLPKVSSASFRCAGAALFSSILPSMPFFSSSSTAVLPKVASHMAFGGSLPWLPTAGYSMYSTSQSPSPAFATSFAISTSADLLLRSSSDMSSEGCIMSVKTSTFSSGFTPRFTVNIFFIASDISNHLPMLTSIYHLTLHCQLVEGPEEGLFKILTGKGELFYNACQKLQTHHRNCTGRPMSGTILLVEDEEYIRENLSEILQMNGYQVSTAANGEMGLDLARRSDFDIVLTDLKLPGMSGIEVVRSVKSISPDTACIILTGYASVETAVEAMRVGAFTYLKKPFSKDELLITIEKAKEVHSLKQESTKLRDEIKKNCTTAILGTSSEIQEVKDVIDKIADTDSTVLILGESGTGKELVARALHYGSTRHKKPFVPINCGAIPEDLLESELFGYEKGAFTGAIATKIGRVEAAHEGTVFLDEIGDMSPGLQVKILRVLQEKEFERVGGRSTIKVDVRVVAATNLDLEKAVEEKKFRNDLYYRLNVIPIHLPPLRDRKEDIPLLVEHFIEKMEKRKKKSIKGVSSEALRSFEAHEWPGNIRELENLMERLIVLKEEGSLITPRDLPEKIRQSKNPVIASQMALPPNGIDFNEAVDNYERELIVSALQKVNGIKKKAAEYLNLNRTTLIEKMKRKGLLDQYDTPEAPESNEVIDVARS